MPRAAGMLRWVVTVLAALSVVGAVGSGWCKDALSLTRHTATSTEIAGLAVQHGCFEYWTVHSTMKGSREAPPGWHLDDLRSDHGQTSPCWNWLRFDWRTNTFLPSGRRMFTAVIPSWLPAVLLLSLTAYAWRGPLRRNARRRAGRCTRCNYDRRGLPDPATTACPECGAPAIG